MPQLGACPWGHELLLGQGNNHCSLGANPCRGWHQQEDEDFGKPGSELSVWLRDGANVTAGVCCVGANAAAGRGKS